MMGMIVRKSIVFCIWQIVSVYLNLCCIFFLKKKEKRKMKKCCIRLIMALCPAKHIDVMKF